VGWRAGHDLGWSTAQSEGAAQGKLREQRRRRGKWKGERKGMMGGSGLSVGRAVCCWRVGLRVRGAVQER
jgi:hypothetical protein